MIESATWCEPEWHARECLETCITNIAKTGTKGTLPEITPRLFSMNPHWHKSDLAIVFRARNYDRVAFMKTELTKRGKMTIDYSRATGVYTGYVRKSTPKVVAVPVQQTAPQTIAPTPQMAPEPEAPTPPVLELPVPERKGVVSQSLKDMVKIASLGQHLFMSGPAGCGKSFYGQQIAAHLQRPFASQSCTEGMSESALLGYLLPISANGSFQYVPSSFVHLYETGGIFLLDELDRADPNTLIILNNALAGDVWHLPQRYNNPVVTRHKDFIAVATANTIGHGATEQYTAANALDLSTLDRFRAGMFMLDYDTVVEKKLAHPGVYNWGLTVRKLINKKQLPYIMSTRLMLDYTKQANAGMGRETWEQSYLMAWAQDDREQYFQYMQEASQ